MLRHADLHDRVVALGMRFKRVEGEYRLSFMLADYQAKGYTRQQAEVRQEAEAYYSDDRDDVYGMAILMAKKGAS